MLRDQTKMPVGHLWKKKDKDQRDYFAGVISLGLFGEIPIVIFPETKKDTDAAPDFVIRVAKEKETR